MEKRTITSKQRIIPEVKVDAAAKTLAEWIISSRYGLNVLVEGDAVVLTQATNGAEAYLVKADPKGDASDFVLIAKGISNFNERVLNTNIANNFAKINDTTASATETYSSSKIDNLVNAIQNALTPVKTASEQNGQKVTVLETEQGKIKTEQASLGERIDALDTKANANTTKNEETENTLTTHTTNVDVHVTQEDKERWDNMSLKTIEIKALRFVNLLYRFDKEFTLAQPNEFLHLDTGVYRQYKTNLKINKTTTVTKVLKYSSTPANKRYLFGFGGSNKEITFKVTPPNQTNTQTFEAGVFKIVPNITSTKMFNADTTVFITGYSYKYGTTALTTYDVDNMPTTEADVLPIEITKFTPGTGEIEFKGLVASANDGENVVNVINITYSS